MSLSPDTFLSTVLTAMGGIAFLLLGLEFGDGLFSGLGVAFTISALLGMSRKSRMTGGWAGAAVIAPPAGMTYAGLLFASGQDCAALAPGIFFIIAFFSLPFCWISAWLYGSSLKLRFPFPLEFPIFLGLIGLFIGLISPMFASCDMTRMTVLSLFTSGYMMAWSGLAFGVRHYPNKDTSG